MHIQMYIDGEWTEASEGNKREIINPFNQEVIATASEGTRSDSEKAIAAARKAFDEGSWARTPASERGEMVRLVGQKIKDNREELAHLETLDTGKTLEESLGDMDDIANVFFYFAGLADKNGGEVIESHYQTQQAKLFENQLVFAHKLPPGITHSYKQRGN